MTERKGAQGTDPARTNQLLRVQELPDSIVEECLELCCRSLQRRGVVVAV
jgi:hypothetical protein